MEQTDLSDGRILTHHDRSVCDAPCPLHSPSDHPYRQYPLGWDNDLKMVTRVTPTGPVFDPDDYRVRTGQTIIIKNAAECLECGDHIESKHRHDFQSCHCGLIFVDGGLEYLRHGGNQHHFNNLSITWRNNV